MDSQEKARATQIRNIEAKTGKSLAQLAAMIEQSGIAKHSEIREMLIAKLGLGYGDANSLVHYAKEAGALAAGGPASTSSVVLDEIYSGKKAGLRPLHEAIMAEVEKLGAFEISPKKGYLSLRRKKQFAMIGPATNDAIEIGLNVKQLPADARLKTVPQPGMCQYKLRLGTAGEMDAKLKSWIKLAFEAAGA